ncbi:hypothetical protein NC653_040636 [Populus alba x Populus x berolinensis]|uniref:Uncharacterized protein n=1 Tax=Populus alba x Populus x berolinensis TaxID=444605 RepID=A0AAD6PN21_9ROSI|nr:hypothetical protein NC653_040636 [Populus alba x Populus x berolinensis]
MGIHWNPCDVQVLKPGWNRYHHYINKFVLSSHRLSFSSSSSWHRIRFSRDSSDQLKTSPLRSHHIYTS